MSRSPLQVLWSALRWLWWLLDATRRTLLNLLLLLLVVALAWALLKGRGGVAPLQDRTTLVVAPDGPIREQFSASGLRASALEQLRGTDPAQTRLRDVLQVLDAAAADPHIHRVLLLTDDFAGAGPATLQEVAAALQRVRAKGKPVTAWGSSFDQRQYFLAAHADEVWMHPMGGVQLTGFGGLRTYWRDALDKAGVTAHVIRAGQFKNAGENFVANEPSPQTLEADKLLYDGLWAGYTGAVEQARKLPAGSLQAALDALPERMAAVKGDSAKLALDEKWVDALKTRDELRDEFIRRGEKDGKTFRQVGFGAYLGRLKPPSSGDAVGVVVAQGAITDGQAPAGTIGGLSTAEMLRAAREDEQIKAVVLRIDSPGGSAFGAELVRREVELLRKAGKPVIASMGDVAASGGYWIASAADEIVASEGTVTGSIGVIAMLPSAERLADRLGVHTGGYATSWLPGAYDARRGLDPRMEKLIQSGVDHVYGQFTGLVAQARKTTPEAIDAVAQGRVWTGTQAQERNLVDRTGLFVDALAAAGERAKLKLGFRVQYLDRSPGRLAQLVALIRREAASVLAPAPLLPAPLQDALAADVAILSALLPQGRAAGWPASLVHCLCEAP